MRRMPIYVLVTAVLWICALLAACSEPSATVPTPAESPTVTREEESSLTAEEEEATATEEEEEVPPATAEGETPIPAESPVAEEESPVVVPEEEFVFAMLMVGPINDGGWSQAHYEGAKYVEERVPNTRFIYVDKVNPGDRPNVKVEQVVDDLVEQGAQLIIANSEDFQDGTRNAARAHPDVMFIHVAGDDVLTGDAPPNLGNLMGQMEYGKMIAGCAAALHTQTGKLSYLGPLINDETRRLVNAAYLGARYCWDNVREDKPADDLSFSVTWIGFWFNIPGQTLDPTQVARDFINAGSDVLLSGIDTTEAIIEANKATQAGQQVYALPYDSRGACKQAPEVCLGVPYFNWGPAYLDILTSAVANKWKPEWQWLGPDWADINNPDTSTVGFVSGPALTAQDNQKLDTFMAGLADGSIKLFKGPLNFQDGTVFLEEGEEGTDEQIWYMPQLLEGIEGRSE